MWPFTKVSTVPCGRDSVARGWQGSRDGPCGVSGGEEDLMRCRYLNGAKRQEGAKQVQSGDKILRGEEKYKACSLEPDRPAQETVRGPGQLAPGRAKVST